MNVEKETSKTAKEEISGNPKGHPQSSRVTQLGPKNSVSLRTAERRGKGGAKSIWNV